MELAAACVMILGLLQQNKLSLPEHQQVEKAFQQIAPECKEAVEKAQKKGK